MRKTSAFMEGCHHKNSITLLSSNHKVVFKFSFSKVRDILDVLVWDSLEKDSLTWDGVC